MSRNSNKPCLRGRIVSVILFTISTLFFSYIAWKALRPCFIYGMDCNATLVTAITIVAIIVLIIGAIWEVIFYNHYSRFVLLALSLYLIAWSWIFYLIMVIISVVIWLLSKLVHR